MNDEMALKLIEGYFDGLVSELQYRQALTYLENSTSANSALTRLYRELLATAGQDHVTTGETMLVFSDPITRNELSEEEQEKFLLHLVLCPNCASDYQSITSFDNDLVRDENLKIPSFDVPPGNGRLSDNNRKNKP